MLAFLEYYFIFSKNAHTIWGSMGADVFSYRSGKEWEGCQDDN